MKTTRMVLAAGMLGATLVATAPAAAHGLDLVTPSKAGPIRRSETTMRQMRRWFGAPTARKVVRVGCVRVIRARWSNKITVYASRGKPRIVEAIFVRARPITSTRHGELNMHTWKGLRVGDRERKLRRLYPRSRPETHSGHRHYRLKTSRFGTYLLAKVVDHRVVRLEVWPYEFC